MPRSDRRLREGLEPVAERAARAPDAVAPLPAAALRMQALAGNRATSELLAREAASERGRDAAAEKPKAPPAPDGTVAVAGFGRYKVHSFHRASNDTVSVALDPGKDAARFTAAAADGKPIATVTITTGGHTITLADVVISGLQLPGDHGQDATAMVEFNAGSIRFE